MADEAEDVLELDPEDVLDDEQDEGTEDEGQADGNESDEGEGGEEESETVIGFEDDEAAPASESENSVIREMRRKLREKDREIAELRKGSAPQKIEVGEKPTLESCDYDEERFEQALTSWHQRKAQADAQENERKEREKKEQEAWQTRIQAFEAGKSRLGVSDFEDAEAEVSAALPNETMAIILHSEKSAEMVYALARSPAKLEELSKLNPLRAAMMIGKLEDKVQMTKRKLPNPDRPVRGNAAPASADKTLARLEAEAERTGDRTKVIRYKRKLQQA